MGFFNSSPSPPPLQPLPDIQKESDTAAKEAAAKEAEALRKRQGRSSTIITGGMGLLEEAPTQKRVLLGE